MITIVIHEALYVDPRAGNDKFYRTFALDSIWIAQYGRNGQIGTFTKPIDAGSPEKAVAAAATKFAAKIKKGYQSSRSGTLTVDKVLDGDFTWLDGLADTLPTGSGDPTAEHVTPIVVELNLPSHPDVTDEITARFSEVWARQASDRSTPDTAPLRPMLASSTDKQGFLDLVENKDWIAQFKYDGDRVVIVVNDGEITVLNRQGHSKTRGISASLLAPFTALHRGRWVFDGEIVDRTIVIFDLIEASMPTDDDHEVSWIGIGTGFDDRYQALSLILTSLPDNNAALAIAPVFRGPIKKLAAYTRANHESREGLILRHRDTPYEQGRRSTYLLKYKFTHTADLIVSGLDQHKESAKLAAFGPDGQQDIGSASTIGKGPIACGEVWEVEFLYVVDPEHPRMVQPRLIRRREDKAPAECTIDQFAHTGTNRSV